MRKLALCVAFVAASLTAAPASAATNAYLQFQSNGAQVEGTVTDAGFEDMIHVFDVHFEISAAQGATIGAARSTRAEYKPIYVTLPVDRSTPLITQALAQNHVISNFKIQLTQPQQGGGEVVYYTIELDNGRVSSMVFDSVAPGDDRVRVGFSYYTMTQTDEQSGATMIVSSVSRQ
ncbi:MAG: type VI secretion system tube protein Hcp [Parvularculaceae bacterium]